MTFSILRIRHHSFKNTHGFTLTELAIVLGVVGIILGGIWGAASTANDKSNNNEGINELQTVTQNILSVWQGRTLPAPYGGAGSDLITNLITGKAIPTWAIVNANNATTPWAGAFVVYATGPTTFRVSFYLVPFSGCINLLVQATSCNFGQSACPLQIWTNGANQSGNSLAPALPNAVTGWQTFNTTSAQALCNSNIYPGNFTGPGAGGTTNSVEFDYSL